MPTQDPQPIHNDIPVDRAWKVGRRIYIRCGYNSKLNQELLALGSKWDGDVGARWVGSGKLAVATPLVLAHLQRIREIEDTKAAGRWIHLPSGAEEIHQRVRTLHGIWDGDLKKWAMRTDADFAEIQQMITDWTKAKAAAQASRAQDEADARERLRQENAAAKVTQAQVRQQLVIDKTTRTVTDERGTTRPRLVAGRMNRAQAEKRKPAPGSVMRLADGRRGLVLDSTMTFYSQDMIDDGFSEGGTSDDPGWRLQIDFAVVEPTPEEIAADEQERAEQADGEEMAAVMAAADRIRAATTVDRLTSLTGWRITESMLHSQGTVITVTGDGAVYYQHPGFYDDYRVTEFVITDPDLVARIQNLIAAGPRTRYAATRSGIERTFTVSEQE